MAYLPVGMKANFVELSCHDKKNMREALLEALKDFQSVSCSYINRNQNCTNKSNGNKKIALVPKKTRLSWR